MGTLRIKMSASSLELKYVPIYQLYGLSPCCMCEHLKVGKVGDQTMPKLEEEPCHSSNGGYTHTAARPTATTIIIKGSQILDYPRKNIFLPLPFSPLPSHTTEGQNSISR